MATVMQYIVPLRNHVIGYMCRLSDTDLRLAGTRNMTDLMWAAVKVERFLCVMCGFGLVVGTNAHC